MNCGVIKFHFFEGGMLKMLNQRPILWTSSTAYSPYCLQELEHFTSQLDGA
jgi:hypothetical protein